MASAPRWWIGICITIASNVLISVALNCQKLAHMRLEEETAAATAAAAVAAVPVASNDAQHESLKQRYRRESTPLLRHPTPATSYLQSRLWWMGFLLMTLGESGNFLSYGFAPASLVSPLGAVSLLSNAVVAPTLLGEHLYLLDIAGMVLSIIGAVSVVCSVGPSGNVPLDPSSLWGALCEPTFVVYATSMLVLGIVLIVMCRRTQAGSRSVLVHVGLCAVFGGFTVLATKAISSFLVHFRSASIVREPLFYMLLLVLLSTAVTQLIFLNQALQRFESRHVIPSQFVLFTISTIIGSSILYHDLSKLSWARLAAFCVGCLCTFLGVFVLTFEVSIESAAPEPPSTPTPDIVCDTDGQIPAHVEHRHRPASLSIPSTPPSPAALLHPVGTAPVYVPDARLSDAQDQGGPRTSTNSVSSLAHVAAKWVEHNLPSPHTDRPSTRVLRRSLSRLEAPHHALMDAMPWLQEQAPNHVAQSGPKAFLSISPGRHLLTSHSSRPSTPTRIPTEPM